MFSVTEEDLRGQNNLQLFPVVCDIPLTHKFNLHASGLSALEVSCDVPCYSVKSV